MAASAISLNFLPFPLRKALLKFQKEGVQFGISKQGRCLIGDEMGLGKTLQAISIAYHYKDAWPLLIVVPSSVKFSWIEEIEKWLPEVEPHNLNLIRSGSDISNLDKAVIHIIGYGLLSVGTSKLLLQALENQKFNVIILDESHYLKTRNAARTKRLHQLCTKAKHAILLSGTPSLARPRELYFQLDIVCPGKFGKYNSFVKRYCDAHNVFYRGAQRYDTSGASNLEELYHLLKENVMIRRLKKEVLTQLPPKRRQKVVFDISESSSKYKKEMQKTMNDFKKCSAILKGETEDSSIQSPLFEMNRLSTLLYHYTGLVKIGPVLKYIEDLAQGMDSKFIVFFRHRLVCQAIVQKLVTLKLKHICIAGDVPSGMRGDLVHSFQTDPQVRIAVLSIEAASFGLTLTAAHHVVFAELHYTPGVIIQAEDRAHRIGQTLPVNVHYLIARGTVDEILWGMIRRKVYVTSTTLDGECKELKAEDGDEDQSRQLTACAAWVQDQEEDAGELEDFVMAQLSSKTLKEDQSQRDLRSFFTPTSSSRRNSFWENNEGVSEGRKIQKGVMPVSGGSAEQQIFVLDSDDDDNMSITWDDVDDDTLMSVSLEVPERDGEMADEHSKKTSVKNVEGDNKLKAEQAEQLEADDKLEAKIKPDAEEEHSALKPKKLKFKKEKDGKLTFTKSKSFTKLQKRESACESSLKFVGDDPDTESQTMQSYLEDVVEPIKATDKENYREMDACNSGPLNRKDRGFLVSLQEADIVCVALVCKRASSITLQSKSELLSNETALETGNQEGCADSSEVKLKGKYSPFEQESVSPLEAKKHCDSERHACSSQTESLSINDSSFVDHNEHKKLQETSVTTTLHEGDFITEIHQQLGITEPEDHLSRNLTVEHSVSVLNSSTDTVTLDTGDSLSQARGCTSEDNQPNSDPEKQMMKCNDGISSLDLSQPLQHFDNNALDSLSQREGDEQNYASALLEEDSSDDFQASTIRQTQAGAKAFVQNSSKSKKGKSRRKKTNHGTAIQEKKTHSIYKEPASWSCSACTLINDGQLLECSICLTPRVTDADTSTTGHIDADIELSITKSQHVVEVETKGLSAVREDPRNISCYSANGELGDEETTASLNETSGNNRVDENTAVQDLCNIPGERPAGKESDVMRAALDDSGLPSWSCSFCTFSNMSQIIECSMCLTPRRRSQRKTTSTYTRQVERRRSHDTVNGDNMSRKRRPKTDYWKTDESSSVQSCSILTGAEDNHLLAETEKRRTPQTTKLSYCESNSVGDSIAVFDHENEVTKSRPRKRLKLGECEDIRKEVIDPDDMINTSTCSSVLSSGVVVEKPSDDSMHGDQTETTQLKTEKLQCGDNDVVMELSDLSDHSVNKTECETALSTPSSEITVVEDSSRKFVENLEELKAAAEEMFMAEWDDSDNCWWEDEVEEESSSGQSSGVSSGETTSSSPSSAQLCTAFTKCSNLYSVPELRNKLQSTPEQPKLSATTEPSELNSHYKISPIAGQQDSFIAESDAAFEEKEIEEPEDTSEPMKLKFCLSLYTERVYFYSEDNKPLGINFCMSDVINGNTEDLPSILHHEYNLSQVKRFLDTWKRMGEGKKRVLRKSALVFDDPLGAYEQARKGLTRESSYVRHPSQETRIKRTIDAAAEIGGKVKVVRKPTVTTKRANTKDKTANNDQSNPTSVDAGSTRDKTCHQAVRADGVPLCLFCTGPVNFADKLKCHDWEKRFCSHDCKNEYQVRGSCTAARRALFESERGVCQLCSLDAHSLFVNVKALQVRDRPAYLAETPYALLPQKTLKKMVMEPQEGMFWEADHITPVSEGGGECGLDNYRTLCVMCHRKVTEELNKRLKQRKNLQYAAGYADISAFFRPLS